MLKQINKLNPECDQTMVTLLKTFPSPLITKLLQKKPSRFQFINFFQRWQPFLNIVLPFDWSALHDAFLISFFKILI